jgi:hypothetical protein
MTPLEAAHRYVDANLAIYPAGIDKRGLIRRWNAEGAVRDPGRVTSIFKEFPNACVGIACGPSRRIVVDVDPRNGGEDSFRKLCGEIGPEAFELCPTTLTPSGGAHYHFRAPSEPVRSLSHALGRGIDVIGNKGGVIAPPSARSEGAYSWRCPDSWPDSLEAPPLPQALLERIRRRGIERATRRLNAEHLPALIERGRCNSSLAAIGIKLRWKFGLPPESLLEVLTQINASRCKPPLEEKEVELIADSASSYQSNAIDPVNWLEGWLRKLTNSEELRIASALMLLAESAFDRLTPSASLMLERTGLQSGHYYTARQRLEEKGAILVHNRGPKAPIIDLIPCREVTTSTESVSI